jgi:6-phosphogluconolactonase (cycloisomerase 2 family)
MDEGGNWTLKEIVPTLENPSYLCLDKSEQYLYTVHGDLHQVSAFKINSDYTLTHINTVDSQGKNPVFITPNKTNQYVFVASLQGGTVATMKIQEDGSLSEAFFIEHLEGLTPEGVSHAHQCILDKTGEFLFVPTQGRHIGYERVFVFKVDNETGHLTRSGYVDARQYAEPRHITLSHDNKRAYLINEKGNTVTYYDFDDNIGRLTPLQIIPSLPDTYVGQGQASAILVHPSDRFVYASNRMHESIVTYRVDRNTGYLTTIGYTSVLGKTPRFICFTPDHKQLLVANEDSDTLQLFDIDDETGSLTFSGNSITTGSPTCVAFKG